MQIINWFETPNWQQNVLLGGVPFNINAYYNVRDTSWYINIFTNENEAIILGKKLIINTDILSSVFSPKQPRGLLFLLPITDVLEITRDNMGIDVELIFVGVDELLQQGL